MENFLSGAVSELEEAKRAIIDEAQKNLAADEAKSACRAKEKELNAKKMFMSDKIESTVKNRRSALEKEHDNNIDTAKRDVKEARKSKREALSSAVNKRMKEETSDIAEENRKLKKANKELFKAARIPGFCNTKYYYALFAPRTGADFLAFVLSIIIAAALIPNVVCAFLTWNIFFKIILYVGIVVFFALIYFLVTIWTKSGQKVSVIEEGRPNMNQIKANKKLIRKRKKGIKSDSNEEQYGLEAYDREIARREEAYDKTVLAKQHALDDYDNLTAGQIRAEIEADLTPQIEKLAAELAQLEEESAGKAAEAGEASERLAAEYTIYLGEKYTTCEKIDELIAIINDGRASDISGALDISRGTASDNNGSRQK